MPPSTLMHHTPSGFPLLTEEKVNFVQSCTCVWKCEGLEVHLGWEWVGGSRHSCEELKWQCDEY